MGGDLVAIARELYIEYTQLAQESQSVLVAGPLNALLKVLVCQLLFPPSFRPPSPSHTLPPSVTLLSPTLSLPLSLPPFPPSLPLSPLPLSLSLSLQQAHRLQRHTERLQSHTAYREALGSLYQTA